MSIRLKTIDVDGLQVFFREAADPARPAVPLLQWITGTALRVDGAETKVL